VRLVTAGGGSGGAQLLLKLSQVEENVALPHEAFRFDVPAAARPISLAELREWGLGAGAS